MRSRLCVAACATLVVSSTAYAQPPGAPGAAETRIGPGQSCPAGQTEIRPRICRAPQLPPPSIIDYRPVSTLVTAEHLVPRAKFPAIDFHGHPQDLIDTPEGLARLGTAMDSINVRLMIAADDISGDRLKRVLSAIQSSPKMKDRVRVLTGIDFNNVGPGWAEKAVKQLDADIAAGAVGVGEIPKFLGLRYKKPDGSRLRIDDPQLDPIWDEAARLGVPVFIHTADPQEFFRKEIDYTNERWLELSLFPGRRYPQDQFPSFDELMTERDNVFRRHPKTTFVAAHMGWHANDLGRLGKLLDQYPNVYTEVGAVLYDIGRQPHAAYDFFVKYQDRIMFGKDSFQPEEYPYYWRVFETRDEYFDYYRHYHAFWKLYGIGLPDSVLKKVYYQNAMKITKGLPKA
ncbi:MAG TPA: amidohydrolase family protein [Gemmatimonadaceae bacterium]|jgi:predicted TIM-barrel fold metal-dependent hydrolase|nr:amidohydrolase family protein [Gemmatimonadaceae bacterium]